VNRSVSERTPEQLNRRDFCQSHRYNAKTSDPMLCAAVTRKGILTMLYEPSSFWRGMSCHGDRAESPSLKASRNDSVCFSPTASVTMDDDDEAVEDSDVDEDGDASHRDGAWLAVQAAVGPQMRTDASATLLNFMLLAWVRAGDAVRRCDGTVRCVDDGGLHNKTRLTTLYCAVVSPMRK
jgi:hypothetical protein